MARLLPGRRDTAAIARMAEMGAVKRMMISEARSARAFSKLSVRLDNGK
jgi:hypothetical protein